MCYKECLLQYSAEKVCILSNFMLQTYAALSAIYCILCLVTVKTLR